MRANKYARQLAFLNKRYCIRLDESAQRDIYSDRYKYRFAHHLLSSEIPMSATTMPASSKSATSVVGPLAVQPYLSFEGRCAEALAFYREALGAEIVMVMHFGDAPKDGGGCDGPMPPADKVMHATLRVGATEFFATDGQCQGPASFKGIALSLAMPDVASAERVFNAIAAKGSVQMPLTETFFAQRFGMASDPFGVQWMIIARKEM
jgi:PhnB protein